MKLLSIQVGQPKRYGTVGAKDPMHKPWTTSFFKAPVSGPVWLGQTNLAGDAQADLRVHGGPDKAVNAYAAEHYAYWQQTLGRPDFTHGAFGENFTVEGMNEETVCLGDVYQIGEAIVEVSQPRGPCWKIARRWQLKNLTAQVAQTGYTGWYFRVLREGQVQAGDDIRLLKRPHPEWSIARANQE
jgi:MOSC domain-containing protein YiiM